MPLRPPLLAPLATAFAVTLAGCGTESESEGTTAGAEPVATAAASGAVGPADAADAAAHPGQAIFETVCSACHTLQPPPNLAPPMMGITGHYHDAFQDRDQAVAAMVSYIQAPDPDRSYLDPEAFDRFGIMAPLALPDADLEAVAGWIWDMYDPAHDPRPPGHRAGT